METISVALEEENGTLDQDVVHEQTCDPCLYGDSKVTAEVFCVDCCEYLCQSCAAFHKKPSITRHHTILSKQELLRTKDRIPMKDTCTELCLGHNGEVLKYFCKLHSSLGCCVCVTLNHRTCKDMHYIPEYSLTYNDESREFEKVLHSVTAKVIDFSKKVEDKIKSVEGVWSEAIRMIKEIRNKVNKMMDRLEEMTMKLVEQYKENTTSVLNSAFAACKELKGETDTIRSETKYLRQKGRSCDLFIKSMKYRETLYSLEKRLHAADDKLQIKEYRFKANLGWLKPLTDMKGLGEFLETSLEGHATEVPPRLFPSGHFSIRSNTDDIPCKITSCATFPNSQSIIITDYNNSKVKLYNTKDLSLISERRVPDRPWDMALLEKSSLAITIPIKKKILFVNAKKDLLIERSISVKGECHGIAKCSKNSLVVTFGDYNQLDIITFDGEVLSVIENKPNQPLFDRPLYVTAMPKTGLIYVTNFNSNSVVCFEPDGSLVSQYSDSQLKGPLNIAIDASGMVYVCGKWSHNVHKITKDCKKVAVCIEEEDLARQPYSICYSENEDRFYVGILDSDNIQIFKTTSDRL